MRKLKKGIVIFIALLLAFLAVACSYNSGENPPTSSGNSSSESGVGGNGSSESGTGGNGSSEGGTGGGGSSNGQEDPPVPTYELIKPINDINSPKTLIKTKYETESAVVADVIATDFGADPSGEEDSTNAIQSAINEVQKLGGGTVFLPIGKYLVSSSIRIPQYVSLVGDWNKPKENNEDDDFDYGTVILAKPKTLDTANPQDRALFYLSNASGIVGMTFYYVDQDASNVKKYGYTIYADAPITSTLRNLTFINSAYGIGVSLNNVQNELVNIENVYGTFLFNAIRHNATTDVGFYDNINVSPKFWQNASSEFRCNDVSSLKTFISNNLTALVLGDLDDQLISNLRIDGGKIGIKFTTGIRANMGFWGLVHNAQISCEQGVYAEYLNSASGVVFTESNVGIIENNSPVGCIKMSNSTYQSKGSGKVLQEDGVATKSVAISPLSLKFSSSKRLFVANTLTSGGTVDNSLAIQEILNLVGEEGGIVLVPNGVYRLNSSVTIPKNVEIRSTQSIFSRTYFNQSGTNGVVFVSYVSGATFVLGENAGVVGVRIWHAKNDYISANNNLKAQTNISDTSIKANGKGAYAYMNESVGAYVGYDFSSCDEHVLKSNYGVSYLNFIRAGGKDGVITQCLSNPNFMTRSNLYEFFDSAWANIENWRKMTNSGESNDDFAVLRDDIGRTHTKMVRIENAENQLALNVFAYGQAGLFDIVNSSVTLVNTSLDYIMGSKIVYELSGGSCDIVGSLRVYGTSVKVNGGRLTACGRIAFGQLKEKTYDSSVSIEDKIDYVSENAKRKVLFDCNSFFSIPFNASYNSDSRYVYEGNGSWKWQSSDIFQGKFTSVDLSAYKSGYLHFYIYCNDIEKIGTDGQIEITSSGVCDVNEYNWNVTQHITKTGWNEVWLDLYNAGTTGGAPDLSCINYMRIYLLNSTATLYIDYIEFVTD